MHISLVWLMSFLWITSVINCLIISAKIVVKYNSSERFVMNDKLAYFGLNIPQNGMGGYLIVAKPLNACTPIQGPPKGILYNYINFFALIEEGDCQFSHQALMADKANYKAAIIYRKNSNNAIAMGAGRDASQVQITAVNIGRDDGEKLKKYDYSTRARIVLLPDINVPLELYLIPFVVVFGVCFLFMAVFSLARYCRHRRQVRANRLSKESLRSIPTKKFKKGDEYDVCAICLDEFEVGDKLRILPCSHVYHCKCVDPWLTGGKKSCPVCNRPVTVARKSRERRRTQSTPEVSSTVDDTQSQPENEDNDEPTERTPLISSGQNNGGATGPMSV